MDDSLHLVGPGGATIPLADGTKVLLGRGLHGLPDNASISRKHSAIEQNGDDAWELAPLGKNGARVWRGGSVFSVVGSATILRIGDKFTLGSKEDAARTFSVGVGTGGTAAGAGGATEGGTEFTSAAALAEAARAVPVQRFFVSMGGTRKLAELSGQGLHIVERGREVDVHGYADITGWDTTADRVVLNLKTGRTVELGGPKTGDAARLGDALAANVRMLSVRNCPPRTFGVTLKGLAGKSEKRQLHLTGSALKLVAVGQGSVLHHIEYAELASWGSSANSKVRLEFGNADQSALLVLSPQADEIAEEIGARVKQDALCRLNRQVSQTVPATKLSRVSFPCSSGIACGM